jgi:hypothetical protein
MGYETKAFIVTASVTGGVDEFVKHNKRWVHAWRDYESDCKTTKSLYHYTETGNDRTEVDVDSETVKRKTSFVLGMVDLCKLGSGNNVPAKESEFYFYGGDGESAVIEDKYGDKLNQMTLQEAIDFFTPQAGYRRVDVLLATLNAVKVSFPNEYIYVLFFGY